MNRPRRGVESDEMKAEVTSMGKGAGHGLARKLLGSAALVFTSGMMLGAVLEANGATAVAVLLALLASGLLIRRILRFGEASLEDANAQLRHEIELREEAVRAAAAAERVARESAALLQH